MNQSNVRIRGKFKNKIVKNGWSNRSSRKGKRIKKYKIN